jgi:hypothetical protein
MTRKQIFERRLFSCIDDNIIDSEYQVPKTVEIK